MQLNLEGRRTETNYSIKLPNDLSDFDIILGMNWLYTYGAKINCEALKVILKDERGEKYVFMGTERKNLFP